MTTTDAFQVIERHQRTLPVDVHAIAREIGIPVYTHPLKKDIVGKIVSDGASPPSFEIYVNSQFDKPTQRLALAHELAHFVLHRDWITGQHADNLNFKSVDAILDESAEISAKALAASILMPSERIHELHSKGVYDTNDLAREFLVSTAAVRSRFGSNEALLTPEVDANTG